MSKLDFINSLIKTYEHSVQEIEQRLQKCGQLGDDEGFKDAIEDLQDNKDILNTYKEIKNVLEAWEEIIKHEFEIDRLDSVAEYWVIHIWKPFKSEEIIKIKKALEVEDES